LQALPAISARGWCVVCSAFQTGLAKGSVLKMGKFPAPSIAEASIFLTPHRLLATVRRFREYPERVVSKRLKRQVVFQRLRYTGYKRYTAGFPRIIEGESVSLRLALAWL
jgi:hypothetical protein